MKRLLIVTTVPVTLCAFLLPYSDFFRSKGWQVDALAQGVSGNAECRVHFDNLWDVTWSRNPLDFRNLTAAPKRVSEVIRRGQYDIVHVHTPIAAFITRVAIGFLPQEVRPKVVYTAHGFHFYKGGNFLKNLTYLSLERIAGRWTDKLIVINNEDHQAAIDFSIVKPENLVYMPGIGLDTSCFSRALECEEDRNELMESIGLPHDSYYFLAIAEFISRKRHRDIIQAFSLIRELEVYLVLAGNGPLLEEMRSLCQQLNIESRVRFLGFRKDVPKLIELATATILASEQEGLPRSILESMCIGTPVIGTKIRGIEDLLGDGRGLLVSLGDTEALSEAMNQILVDSERSKIIKQKALEYIPRYDIRKLLDHHDGLYNSLLG